jgi:RNA polymerase sigma factor (TIGR02999 family)
MTTPSRDGLADLIRRAQAGQPGARDELVTQLYQDFRRIAARRMRRERPGHTLQPTALANEALAKILADDTLANATGRSFLYQAAGKAMEQVLIDHQRKRDAKKRPGRRHRVSLDAALDHLATVENLSLTDLREALDGLARLDERARLVVELRFFLGMTQGEVGEMLGVSQKTVERVWSFARGWLLERLKPCGDP